MKNKIILSLFLLLITSFIGFAEMPVKEAQLIEKANKEYNSEKYYEAKTDYENVVSKFPASAELLYNLGNTYVKLHDLGNARLCYERALRIEPTNKSIQNNLDYVAIQVEKQNKNNLKGKPINISPEDLGFVANLYNSFTRHNTSNFWSVSAAIIFVISIFLFAIYVFGKQIFVRKIGFFGSFILVGISITFIIFSLCSAKEAVRKNEIVVTANVVTLKSEASENSKDIFPVLNSGTKMEIVKTEGDADNPDWYEVRLNSDISGWIKSSDMQVI